MNMPRRSWLNQACFSAPPDAGFSGWRSELVTGFSSLFSGSTSYRTGSVNDHLARSDVCQAEIRDQKISKENRAKQLILSINVAPINKIEHNKALEPVRQT
ncbi:hypothetical protein AB9F46_28095 [Rhizobium leguminosarum]|uniref:hypothetical protein n=1 Tax=Rhizobium leguminosarum TaxID=384 RepID=UPI003F98B1D6